MVPGAASAQGTVGGGQRLCAAAAAHATGKRKTTGQDEITVARAYRKLSRTNETTLS